MLEALAQPQFDDNDLEGLISQLLNIEFAHRRGEALDYAIAPGEIKRALSVDSPGVRATAAWLLWRAMGDENGEPANKATRWRTIVGPLFRDV
jgi:hypothetical protein